MSEEEYDNLDEEERKKIDLIRLEKRYLTANAICYAIVTLIL